MFLIPWRRQAQSSGLSRRNADPFDLFHGEMDRLLEQFFGGPPTQTEHETGSQRFWGMEMHQEGNDIIIRAEMPGFEEKDLDVQIDGDLLTIRAEKKQQDEKKGFRGSRSYTRTITLPPGLDNDKAQATCEHGVLELRIPRSERAQARRIPIQGRSGMQQQPPGQQQQSQITEPKAQVASETAHKKEGNGAAQQDKQPTAEKQEKQTAGTAGKNA
jgi:HSP20 family protein